MRKIQIINDCKAFWPLVMANALYYLFEGMSASVIGKEVYSILPPQLISLQSIISWGGGILLGLAWSKWNKKLFKIMIPLYILQLIACVLYFIYSEITLNMFIFWVLSMGMFIFFGGLCDKIFDSARAWFFHESEERASYDNIIDIVCCVTGFLGYLISMIYVPSLRMAVLFNFCATFFWCLGVIIYSITHKEKILQPEDDKITQNELNSNE